MPKLGKRGEAPRNPNSQIYRRRRRRRRSPPTSPPSKPVADARGTEREAHVGRSVCTSGTSPHWARGEEWMPLEVREGAAAW